MESIHEIVRKSERNYLQLNTRLGKYVTWSMHDTIERIDAYLNSKHTSGPTDSLGRDKPFFNIVTAATNIWYRATKIDRKDIKFVPTNSSSVVLAFVANVILQKWMNDERFGQFLTQWGRTLARYGSALPKFVEKDGKLVPSVVAWNRFIADPIQFDAMPRIEKIYYTPEQLRSNSLFDQVAVNKLIEAKITRRTLDKLQKDIMPDFIEVFEVHGKLDSRLLLDKPDISLDETKIEYVQQMQIVSYFQQAGESELEKFTLYKGREAKDPYMITHLIEEDGRTLSIGAVEYLFDAQWMQNHSVKNMKDTLDIASRLIFQTADTHFVGRNVLSAIETGDIFVHEKGNPLERVANDKPDVSALMDYRTMWQNLGQDLTATPDAMRGQNPPANQPYSTTSLMAGQSNSLFEVMTENKGLYLEDILREFVIPYIKKQLKNKDEVVAILDGAGIDEIDAMYIPHEAVKRYNKRSAQQALDYIANPKNADGSQVSPIQPFNAQQEQQGVRQDLGPQGNKRFFKPDELDKKTWAELFNDFEWDSIKVEVTNENTDKQVVLQTLSSVLQTIASNPAILQDANAKMVFSSILSETGVISPLQLQTSTSQPPQQPQQGQQGSPPMNPLQPQQATPSPMAGFK